MVYFLDFSVSKFRSGPDSEKSGSGFRLKLTGFAALRSDSTALSMQFDELARSFSIQDKYLPEHLC